jgi:hypothetical protein
MKMKFHHSSWQGFSLMELQIVVVMLVILTALFLPLLESFKRASQQAGCFNNLKQLGVADLVYVADNGVFIEPGASKYLGNDSEWIGCLLNNTSRNTNVLLCPTASQPPPAAVIAEYDLNGDIGDELNAGAADYCYTRSGLIGGTSGLTEISASYMANGWLYDMNGRGLGDGPLVEEDYGVSDPTWVYTNETSMNFPATTPMFFDGTWFDCWPAEEDSPAKNLYTGILGEQAGRTGVEMGRITMTRHGINPEAAERNHTKSWKIDPPGAGLTDMVFGDGHTAPVKVNLGLWNLTWHRNWGVNVPINPGFPE